MALDRTGVLSEGVWVVAKADPDHRKNRRTLLSVCPALIGSTAVACLEEVCVSGVY